MDKKTDGAAFKEAIAALALSFGKEGTVPMFNAYWLGLSDMALEAVQQAVAKAIRSSEHFPRPVDLRRLAGEQTAEQRAIAAWGDVQRAVPRGAYKHIDFADKLVNAAVRNLGGWPTFVGRLVDAESEKWARLEFIKAYTAMASSGVNGEACLPLPGLAQQTAIGGIVQSPIPLRIGCDAERLALPCPVREPSTSMALPRIEFQSVQ